MLDVISTWSLGVVCAAVIGYILFLLWGWLATGVNRLAEGGEIVFELAAMAAVRTLAIILGIGLPIAACLALYSLGRAIQAALH